MPGEKDKIIFIVNNVLFDSGGGQKAVAQIISNLDFNKYEILFISLEFGVKKQEFSKEQVELPSQVKLIPIFSPDILNPLVLKSFWQLGRIIKKEKPQITFITAAHHIKALLFFLIRIISSSTKIIFNEHSPHPPTIDFKSFFNKVLYMVADKTIIKMAYPRADKIIFVSKELMNVTKERYNLKEDKICTIYNPVVTEKLLEKAQKKIEHPWFKENTPIILSVGRLDPYQKDFPTLLKAFAKVKEKTPARLVILGEGPQEKELKRQADELSIADDVYFAGYQDNPYKYMANSDVLVLSTKYEALPTVPIEGLACGVPVVSSNCVSGPEEILKEGECGKLVPVGDEEALAEAIVQILKNDELAEKLIKKGKKRASDFTIEKSIPQYEEVFDKLIEDHE